MLGKCFPANLKLTAICAVQRWKVSILYNYVIVSLKNVENEKQKSVNISINLLNISIDWTGKCYNKKEIQTKTT